MQHVEWVESVRPVLKTVESDITIEDYEDEQWELDSLNNDNNNDINNANESNERSNEHKEILDEPTKNQDFGPKIHYAKIDDVLINANNNDNYDDSGTCKAIETHKKCESRPKSISFFVDFNEDQNIAENKRVFESKMSKNSEMMSRSLHISDRDDNKCDNNDVVLHEVMSRSLHSANSGVAFFVDFSEHKEPRKERHKAEKIKKNEAKLKEKGEMDKTKRNLDKCSSLSAFLSKASELSSLISCSSSDSNSDLQLRRRLAERLRRALQQEERSLTLGNDAHNAHDLEAFIMGDDNALEHNDLDKARMTQSVCVVQSHKNDENFKKDENRTNKSPRRGLMRRERTFDLEPSRSLIASRSSHSIQSQASSTENNYKTYRKNSGSDFNSCSVSKSRAIRVMKMLDQFQPAKNAILERLDQYSNIEEERDKEKKRELKRPRPTPRNRNNKGSTTKSANVSSENTDQSSSTSTITMARPVRPARKRDSITSDHIENTYKSVKDLEKSNEKERVAQEKHDKSRGDKDHNSNTYTKNDRNKSRGITDVERSKNSKVNESKEDKKKIDEINNKEQLITRSKEKDRRKKERNKFKESHRNGAIDPRSSNESGRKNVEFYSDAKEYKRLLSSSSMSSSMSSSAKSSSIGVRENRATELRRAKHQNNRLKTKDEIYDKVHKDNNEHPVIKTSRRRSNCKTLIPVPVGLKQCCKREQCLGRWDW